MKGLTKIVAASALGLSLSISAMAADEVQNNVSLIGQSTSDMSYAFADSENLQVKSISSQEMEATEGAWFPVALNLAGRVVTSQVAKHHMSNAGLVYGTYQTGKAWSGKSSNQRRNGGAGGRW
ncbi:hypothetical protein [Shewanella electrodiphila]|uniref:Uncharacterized protein n=2 Tax=Gammaproteobacteria TaxID=1236 RepID=A0ABT0KVY6_9GAMM|nr:hypothetical protein [Shewanella electrodiphila]MCL1047944.1 hypothetical protein [Shewanella electrodiphila]